MIKEITVRNFKSHCLTLLTTSNLTVLCGANGGGKSSFTQSLLLLRDNFMRDRAFDNLDLNSRSVKVGTVSDAIYEFADTDGFEFSLKTNKDSFKFVYEAESEDAKVRTFARLNLALSIIPSSPESESLFNSNFQYVSAFRLGPQVQYLKDDKIVAIYRQISDKDGQAEYSVHFLDHFKNKEILKELAHECSEYQGLFTQVIAWGKEISEGVNIEVQDLGKLGYALRYSYDAERSAKGKTRSFEAINVGFGITYMLPILIAILSANSDALIIIENPEAHLHPNSIAGLTKLIARAAQAGIQIIIETHSDHVINGVLVQCKLFESTQIGIDRRHVSLYQFDRSHGAVDSSTTRIVIDEGGRLQNQPDGFFDRIDKDLEKILGF